MADMKRNGEKKISDVTQQLLGAHEWNFKDVPDDQFEACYLYEYAREFFKSSKHLKKFQKEWNDPAKKESGEDYVAWSKALDLLQTRCKNFPYIHYDYFPKIAWQDLTVGPKRASKAVQKNLREWLAEEVNDWSKRFRKSRFDRLYIGTLREFEPPNVHSLEAFRFLYNYSRNQDLGNVEYGFFAINWDFKDHQIIEAFKDWLDDQREARRIIGLKEAKHTVSRGGFSDKLNWLGALRVKNHYPHRALVEYPSGRIMGKDYEFAPYKYYPDLHENALKAEQEIARMFPKDWSEAEWKRKEQKSEERRAKYGSLLPSSKELDSKANH